MNGMVGRLGDIVLIGLDTSVLGGPYSHNITQAPPPRHTAHVDVSGFKAQSAIGEALPVPYRKSLPKHHQADKEVFPSFITKAEIKGQTWCMVSESQCLQSTQGSLRGREKTLGVGVATQVDDPHDASPEVGQEGFERAERVGR